MHNKPGIQVFLSGDKEHARSFVPQAFRVYEQYLRDRENSASRLEDDVLKPRVPGALVRINIHKNQAEIHVHAEPPEAGADEEEKKNELGLTLPRKNEKVFTRFYIHVDIITDNTDAGTSFLRYNRDDVSSAVAVGIWDDATKSFVDVRTKRCPYIGFLSATRFASEIERTEGWEAVFCDMTGKEGNGYENAINWYETFIPSKYGAGSLHTSIGSLQPGAAILETALKVPPDPDTWYNTTLAANNYYLHPFHPDFWFKAGTDDTNVLYYDDVNGCSATDFALSQNVSAGTVDEDYYSDLARKYFDLTTTPLTAACANVQAYRYKDTSPNPDQRIHAIGYASPVFGPILNVTSVKDGYGNDDVGMCTPVMSPWGELVLFDYFSACFGGALKDDWYPPQMSTVYPGVIPTTEPDPKKLHSGLSEAFGGMGFLPSFPVMPDGTKIFADTMLANVRDRSAAGYELHSLVNLNLAAGKWGGLFSVKDTPEHLLPTAALVDLYKQALVAAGGYVKDPATITDKILEYGFSSATYGGITHDVRALPGTVAGSPILNMKVLFAPIRVIVDGDDEAIFEGVENDG